MKLLFAACTLTATRIKNKEQGKRKGALNASILGDHRCPPCHEWVTTHLSATVSNFSFRF